jgi:hypothetical protein
MPAEPLLDLFIVFQAVHIIRMIILMHVFTVFHGIEISCGKRQKCEQKAYPKAEIVVAHDNAGNGSDQ